MGPRPHCVLEARGHPVCRVEHKDIHHGGIHEERHEVRIDRNICPLGDLYRLKGGQALHLGDLDLVDTHWGATRVSGGRDSKSDIFGRLGDEKRSRRGSRGNLARAHPKGGREFADEPDGILSSILEVVEVPGAEKLCCLGDSRCR